MILRLGGVYHDPPEKAEIVAFNITRIEIISSVVPSRTECESKLPLERTENRSNGIDHLRQPIVEGIFRVTTDGGFAAPKVRS
jgi:hypothetical protein